MLYNLFVEDLDWTLFAIYLGFEMYIYILGFGCIAYTSIREQQNIVPAPSMGRWLLMQLSYTEVIRIDECWNMCLWDSLSFSNRGVFDRRTSRKMHKVSLVLTTIAGRGAYLGDTSGLGCASHVIYGSDWPTVLFRILSLALDIIIRCLLPLAAISVFHLNWPLYSPTRCRTHRSDKKLCLELHKW